MKILIKLGTFIVLGIVLATSSFATEKNIVLKKSSSTKVTPAPNFTLYTTKGASLTLSDFKGKVVIIDFWATWCSPCRAEIPGFIELYDKYRKDGLVIIGISVDREKEQLISFVKNEKINYPIVFANREVTKAYGGIQGIPTTFIVDRKGMLRNKFVGYSPPEVFEKEIQKLLKQK